MLHRMIATGFQNIVEANKVGFDIYIRIGDTVPDTGLCRQVDDHFRLRFGKDLLNECLVGEVAFYESPCAVRLCSCKLTNFRKSVFLNGNIIIVVYIVKTDKFYVFYSIQKRSHKVCTDKTGSACNKNRFAFKIYIRR